MTHQREHADNLPPAETEEKIWQLAEDIGICMLTTWSGTEQHSRPLSARVDRDAHAIFFLVDEGGHKNKEIARFPEVSCAFVDTSANNYVVIAGEAAITNDRAKINEIWTDFAKAWWENADDPAIRLLTVKPTRGELWDGPHGPVAMAKLALGAMTGNGPDMGDTGKTPM